MSYQVRLTSRAERDVDGILAWLRQHSPQGAAAWFGRWNDVIQDLSAMAGNYDLAPENDSHDIEIRHVLFKTRRGKKYRALFIIRESQVYIIHVRGPGQDLIPPEEIELSSV
jgi:toxin ParE1/3/4